MKFTQIPLGTRFEFEGKIFSKTGPMTASAEDGSGQRLIPRYAVLKPVDGAAPVVDAAPARQVDEARVIAAFDGFYGTCLRLVDDFSKAELEAARRKFLAALQAQK